MINLWNRLKLQVSRLSITAQISILFLSLTAAFIVTATAIWTDAGEQATRGTEHEIDTALQFAETSLTEQTRDVNTLGTWVVNQQGFVRLVEGRDTVGLARFLQPLTKTSIFGSTTVAGSDGIVLTRLANGQPMSSGDSALDFPGVGEGLSGQESSNFTTAPMGGLQQNLILPIFDAEKKSTVGVMLISVVFDQVFASQLSQTLGREVAIAYNGEIVASTMTDAQGRPWTARVAPPQVARAEVDRSDLNYLTIDTGSDTYLFRFTHLSTTASNRSILLGVGSPLSDIESARLDFFKIAGLNLSVIALAIMLLCLFFMLVLLKPVQRLVAVSRVMATGDLTQPVLLGRQDELGELARNLDNLRQNLDRTLQAAVLEKRRYAAIIQSMGMPAVVTDHDQRMLAANRAAEMLLGRSESNLIGHPLQELFLVASKSEQVAPPAWNVGSVGLNGDHTIVVHARFPLRDRRQTIVDVISTRVEVKGEQGGYVHLLQDVTPQEQFSVAKDEFLFNVAHELRTPLSSLRTSIDLLLEDYGTMSRRDFGVMLRSLQKSSIKFQTLVENLVEIGSIKAGRFRVRPVPTSLDNILRDAINQTAPVLQSRGQVIELKQEGAAGLMVMADRRRILQVVINLLTNASKYGPEEESIILSTCHEDGIAYIGVTDCGPGIPAEEQQDIFQRFYRTKNAEDQGSGIGLGLALAREIVEAHGGAIYLTSAPGLDTTFWFSIPESTVLNPETGRPNLNPSLQTRN